MRLATAVRDRLCLGFGLGLGMLAGGCGHEPRLVPAATAERAADIPSAAATEVAGVRVAVEGDAWPMRTVPLVRGVTPVLVMLENRGDTPVVIHHADFALAGDGGERFEALPPDGVSVSGPTHAVQVPELMLSPVEPAASNRTRPLPPGPNPNTSVSRWETSFPENQFYIRGTTVEPSSQRREPLARALPEGKLASGQKVAGFVYFGGGLGGERRLTFEARLVREAHGAPSVDVAQATIPMRVQ